MAAQISYMEITGLHGYKNIKVLFQDNKLILVGTNGIGKTTVMNLLYYFLTCQWKRIAEYEFQEITLVINNTKHTVNREDIILAREYRADYRREFSAPEMRRHMTSEFRYIQRHFDQNLDYRRIFDNKKIQLETVEKIARELKVPVQGMMKYLDMYYTNRFTKQQQLEFFEDREKLYDRLREIEKNIQEAIAGQVLYLPTYRRIEQDLKAIFPELDEEITSRRSEDPEDLQYIELVEFGMQDVEQKIIKVLNELKEQARTELNNLAGGYLRDVIRNEADTYELSIIKSLGDEDITHILSRVEERTLSGRDKNNIKEAINRIKTDPRNNTDSRDKYLAHFFSKLVNINNLLKEKEYPIKKFIEVCNKYLESKKLLYDDVNYEIAILGENKAPIEMKMLSSGEKQIVSLFAHLYLSDVKSYYIIIDEPELSLSVEWQKLFLPDIVATERCVLLAAVTHSPFIYDNNLEQYSVDLRDCFK